MLAEHRQRCERAAREAGVMLAKTQFVLSMAVMGACLSATDGGTAGVRSVMCWLSPAWNRSSLSRQIR